MESLGIAVGLGVLVAASVHAGRDRARTTLDAVLFGIAAAIAAVAAAGVLSIAVVAWDPSSVDVGDIGVRLAILAVAGPIVGMALTLAIHRRALKDASKSAEIVSTRLRALEGGRP